MVEIAYLESVYGAEAASAEVSKVCHNVSYSTLKCVLGYLERKRFAQKRFSIVDH